MPEFNDGYVIRTVDAGETGLIWKMITEIYEGMPDKTLFALTDEDEEWVRSAISENAVTLLAEDAEGRPAGFLITILPGKTSRTLGRDAGLPEEELDKVLQLEMCMVYPEHRGHHLEKRLIFDALERVPAERYPYVTASADPANVPSCKSIMAAGLKIAVTKEKYGGFNRHVFFVDRREKC